MPQAKHTLNACRKRVKNVAIRQQRIKCRAPIYSGRERILTGQSNDTENEENKLTKMKNCARDAKEQFREPFSGITKSLT